MTKTPWLAFVALLALVTAAYSNHFHNAFHFDDFHTIVQNPYVTSPHYIPGFFRDAETSSVLPANRVWRPLVFASLAIDYWLGGGLKPLYFHLSTFVWFLILLWTLFTLFRNIMDHALPHPANGWTALFAASVFGLHPAIAETVNYINQRADLYSTLGAVAGVAVYACFPRQRRFLFYLLPVALALLSKAPAVVFPVLLFLYIWLSENESPAVALRRSIPALVAAGALVALSSAMTPRTFAPGAGSAYAYRITQPLVIFRYFRSFFIPTGLSADTDRTPFTSIFDDGALFGFIFVAALVCLAVWTAKAKRTRPIAFGLFWFLAAVLPTSIYPLAEVENDHRMFFPFVGLALSAVWAVALWLYSHSIRREFVAIAAGLVLTSFAWGTWQRNEVWKTEESLWYDVTVKSPNNGRGLMNYGLTQMQKGQLARALDYFQRALVLNPAYYVLEVNLGVVNGALGHDAEAEKHFLAANRLAPDEAIPHYFYGSWLHGKGRDAEAIAQLNAAIGDNPSYLDASHLLMSIFTEQHDTASLRVAANDVLARFPTDSAAKASLANSIDLKPTPESYLNQSLVLYQQGKFEASIQAAREALKLRPGYSEAWNNIAAAYNMRQMWDQGIEAASQAVRAAPGNQLARNNLAWAIQQKRKTAPGAAQH